MTGPETTQAGSTGSMGETMFQRRHLMGLGAGAMLTTGFGLPAAAQQKMVFKASDVHPEGYPTVTAVEGMGKKLSAATDGRLSVQMYASMQLGGEKEAIEQAQIGAIAIARVPQHRPGTRRAGRADRSGAAR
jgi:TRAP-type C4-dicarboxylate transport system substrate-binding protein